MPNRGLPKTLKSRPKIIGLIEAKIRQILEDQTIRINEIIPETNRYGFTYGNGFQYCTDQQEESRISILPIRKITAEYYWLTISMVCHDIALDAISITVFLGRGNEKLFRAEWAKNKSNFQHAQPHWHIHQSNITNFDNNWNEGDFSKFEREAFEVPRNNLNKIHFAMSANWHQKDASCVNEISISNNEVVSWIDGVMNYIILQLAYINDKNSN
jgi:hypothetical protein